MEDEKTKVTTTAETENKQEEKKDNKKRLIIIILLILLLFFAGAFAYVMITGDKDTPESGSGGGVGMVVDPDAGEYVDQSVDSSEQMKGVTIPGWGSLTIPPNTTELKNMVNFNNPEENEGLYYLTFELRLPDDSEQGYEVLYKSDLIPPGKCIQSITISRGLPKGEYDAVIHVQPYTMDDAMTPTNNADMNTKIIVK